MPYHVSTESYAGRVEALLARGDEPSLLYAALELRCGVEGRMKEYLDPLDHIPRALKKEYSVVKLGKTVDNAFQVKDQICLVTVAFPDGREEVLLRYVPVPKRLQEIAARVGDALHFPGETNTDDSKWWERLRSIVEEGRDWLYFVAAGDLMGLPLINRKTKQTILRIVLGGDDPRRERLSGLAKGAEHLVHFAYEPVPATPPRRGGEV